jgi:Protein of unknown function (DUF3108)
MPRKGWQGSSLWLGVGVTLLIHLAAGWLIAQWQIPAALDGSRLVSVLIAQQPTASAPEPPRTTPPTRQRPVVAPSSPEMRPLIPLPVLNADSLPSMAMPEIAPAPALSTLTQQAAPRPKSGIDLGSLPTRMLLRYSVRSSVVDGRAQYDFRRRDDHYTISGFLEADGFFAQMFAGRFEQESEGTIGPEGLLPSRFSLKRGDSPAEVATFDRNQRKVVHQRIKSEHLQALESGAQDLQSFIFQFGPELTLNPSARQISFSITNARKMDRYEFEVRGRETISTVLGNVETIHLVRRADDPADAYEAWLSPRHQFLPVRLRYLLGGRFQVEQNLASLTLEP